MLNFPPADPRLARLLEQVSARAPELAATVARLAAISAPTFREAARAQEVEELFQRLELAEVRRDALGNVLARWGGVGGAAASAGGLGPGALLVSAHLDTAIEAPECRAGAREVPVRREAGRLRGVGVGDDAAGLAQLLGQVRAWRAAGLVPAREVVLAATVGEEGLGNLRGIRAVLDELMARGALPAAHVALDGALGEVAHRALPSVRWALTILGPGGHSWGHAGRPSAITELARRIVRLSELVGPSDRTQALNVGVVRGGRGVNVIADEARCELDLRAERLERLAALEERARAVCVAPAPEGLRLELEELGRRPGGATPEAHPLVRAARAAWELSGVPPQPVAASTEANAALARGVPALGFGVATSEGTHTPDESLLVESLESGARALARLVFELAGVR